MLLMEKLQPSMVGKGGFAPVMRLTGAVGLAAGFLTFYQRSARMSSSPIPPPHPLNPNLNPQKRKIADALKQKVRFYGFTENRREELMDMREMVTKVKAGEPLYGTSTTTPYIQGMASRNSRYTAVWFHIIPWFNFVNHNQHGVDTAKYYQQAERELAAEGK
jgi:hypothetical protein